MNAVTVSRDVQQRATPPPAVLVYRDFLLPFSETFIQAQADAMRRYRPIFVGRTRVAGLELTSETVEVVDDGTRAGYLRALCFRMGWLPSEFGRRLRRHQARVIHAHFGPDALNAIPVARSLRLPLVATFHGYDVTGSTTLADGLLAYRYGRRRSLLAKHTGRILAVSDFIHSRLLDLGMPESLVVTHRIGVDLTRFPVVGLRERNSVVLAVGRFVEKKGFEHLIDAVALLQSSVPQLELVIIGSGPLEHALRQRAATKVRNCTITGPLPKQSVAEWMRKARILVVPSVTARNGETEGLPMTAVEAIAGGLPVVATAHAGIPEAVLDGVTGLLVPERDVSALAERIRALFEDDLLWNHLASGAHAHAAEHFDIQKQTAALEEIYQALS